MELGDSNGSREKIRQCIASSKLFELSTAMQNEAALLFVQLDQANRTANRIQYNNHFTFAKSQPVHGVDNFHNIVIQNQIQDQPDNFINELAESGKMLNLNFDVLNVDFLRNIKDFCPQILHLTPYLPNTDDNN